MWTRSFGIVAEEPIASLTDVSEALVTIVNDLNVMSKFLDFVSFESDAGPLSVILADCHSGCSPTPYPVRLLRLSHVLNF